MQKNVFICIHGFYSLLRLGDKGNLNGMSVANKKHKGAEEMSLLFDTCKLQFMT